MSGKGKDENPTNIFKTIMGGVSPTKYQKFKAATQVSLIVVLAMLTINEWRFQYSSLE